MHNSVGTHQSSNEQMTEQRLQELVSEISLYFFRKPFNHKATFNRCLKTTGGRYHLHSHNLDFNPKVMEIYGEGELINVIKHELCHYHLHLEGRGYQHKDKEFKELLKLTGGTRYVRPLMDSSHPSLHYYKCKQCGASLSRKRRVNTTRFVCGKCHGVLEEIMK